MRVEPSEPSMSLRKRFLSPQTAISFCLLAALIGLLLTRFDIAWNQTLELMLAANPLWYLAAFLAHYTTFYFRGARWRILLENAAARDHELFTHRSSWYYGRIILISWFANSVTFFRMGDAYRAYVYSEDSKSNFPRTVGTVLADRLVDLGIVAALMGLGLALLLVTGRIDPPLVLMLVAVGLFGLILFGLLAMMFARPWIVSRLPGRLGSAYQRFHDGIMGSFDRLGQVFALGILGWLSEVTRLFLVIQALGLSAPVGLVVFVPMANGLLSAIPLTPGGLGVVETGISGLLQLELTVELAVAVALLDRTISYLSIILLGGIAFLARQFAKPGGIA